MVVNRSEKFLLSLTGVSEKKKNVEKNDTKQRLRLFLTEVLRERAGAIESLPYA